MYLSNHEQEMRFGNIVAIEGNADLVATQLRLLPPSSKILVLPALSTALPLVSAEIFEARRWIRHVYHASTIRFETARSFLQPSTSAQPRLVFINGGSVSARVECISRIAEQLTNGRIDEAETIFNHIVKDGAVGLMRPDHVEEDVVSEGKPTHKHPTNLRSEQSVSSSPDFSGSLAMKAADRLDRQTADLQPRSDSIGPKEHRPTAVENIREDCGQVGSSRIKTTVVIVPDELEKPKITLGDAKYGAFGILPATTYSPEPPRNNEAAKHESWYECEDGLEYGADFLSNGDMPKVVPGIIEVGKAQVIRLEQATIPRCMRSVKSVDETIRSTIKATRQRSRSLTPKVKSDRAVAHRAAALKGLGIGRRASLSDLQRETPRVRVLKTIIKKSSTKSSSPTQSMNSPRQFVYVDRGTNTTEELSPYNKDRASLMSETVFAVVEDLVIHFTDGAHNSLLESVVRSYKNGSYPVIPHLDTFHSSQPNTPRSLYGLAEERSYHHWTAESYDKNRKCDPHSPEDNQKQVWGPRRKVTKNEYPPVSRPAPPLSPAATPPLTQMSIAHRFHRLSTNNSKTATDIQNSLRAVLNVHFPPVLTNYRQYSVAVEADRLWKPVFRDSEGHFQEGKTVDLIIAIGAEDGVKCNLFNEIAGQVERLGTKRNGTTRSGKIDMRFLIASAMQTFTTQPLSYQSQSSASPFSSPMLLASLLVPQLEIYLANNVAIRFLLVHYSASHLPTILALRHLIGADTFKIAGILDSSNLGSQSAVSNPLRPVGNPLSNANVAAFHDRNRLFTRSSERLTRNHSPSQSIDFRHNSSESISTSFLRANYLLPYTASEVEVSTFLSNITDHLIQKSSYYTPEPKLYSQRKVSSPLLSPAFPNALRNASGPRKAKSEATTTSKHGATGLQSPTEKDGKIEQSKNGSILQSQSIKGNYATTPTRGTFPTTTSTYASSTKPDSRGHSTTPSTASISSSPAAPAPYSPDSSSHSPFAKPASTASNSSPISNSTMHRKKAAGNPLARSHGTSANPSVPHHSAQPQLPPWPPALPVVTAISPPRAPSPTEVATLRQSEQDWANFYFGSSDEEEDEMDRILMPKMPRKIEKRKGNARKALQFLGLG